MSTLVHPRCIYFVLLGVLLLASALPLVARSQEESSDSIQEALEDNQANTSAARSLVETQPVSGEDSLRNHPYEIESLPYDDVVGDFVLSPGKAELQVAPGETKTIQISVANRIGKPHVFKVSVEDMTGSSDPARAVVLLGNDTGPYTLKNYISIPHERFELDHGKRALIPVTISVPANAEPGGRYGSVLVETVTSELKVDQVKEQQQASPIVSRIGALFFVTIPGEIERAGVLRDFSLPNNTHWYTSGPIDFAITYENTGSIHLNPYGEITITNMLGDEVGFTEIEPWFTMPKSIRTREINWNRELLYGRYTATLSLNRGYNNEIDTATVVFWVVPIKLILYVFGGIFLLFFVIRFFTQNFEFKRKT